MTKLTPFQQFCDKWKDGCGADICGPARNVVISRGKVPCDMLFIGLAPGKSENSMGIPFCGPAGHKIDQMIHRALKEWKTGDDANGAPTFSIRYALTNLVGCVPREADGSMTHEPTLEDIEYCIPRLVEFVGLCNPRLIVAVGTQAKEWTEPGVQGNIQFHRSIPTVHIEHPAWILRQPAAAQSQLTQRSVVTIMDAVRRHVERK